MQLIQHLETMKLSIDTTGNIGRYLNLYRGANSGLKKMNAGSFYSSEIEIASEYAELQETPCIYSFGFKNDTLRFLKESHCNIDEGVKNFTKEQIENYDGAATIDGIQFILFGEVNCIDGSFKKLSYENVLKQSKEFKRQEN
jgi:hypothetical protein